MKFLVFEGLDGVGKTTHIARLVKELRSRGVELVVAREPGGTPAGEKIRELVISRHDLDPITESLLFAASRAQLVSEVIKPAIQSGKLVICDRYLYSSLAYQGAKLAALRIINNNHEAIQQCWPDQVFYLKSSATRKSHNRFDRLSPEERAAVAQRYEFMIREDPSRWTVVDTDRDEDLVANEILSVTLRLING